MILFWTTIDETNEIREFSIVSNELETGLDLLSGIVGRGHHLLTAGIIDGDYCIDLPLDAFDGRPFSSTLQRLAKEWQQILDQPVSTSTSQPAWFVDLIRHRAKRQLDRIHQLERVLENLEQQLYLLKQKERIGFDSSSQVLRCLAATECYQRHLVRARAAYENRSLQQLVLKL